MIHVATITQNADGSWSATWLTTHASNGVEETGADPIEALHNLVIALEASEQRRELIAQIDAAEDT